MAVLACFEDHAANAECGAGIPGALPAIDAINECCIQAPASQICTRTCEAVLLVSVATPFFEEGCAAWIPCVADGEACEEAAQCCSGDCDEDGFCAVTVEPPACADNGASCSEDAGCCSGDCGEDGTCQAVAGGACAND